jgi:hypothetical protein
MFGLGLAKLIFLVGVLLAVIYGSRLLRHVQALRAAEDQRRAAAEGRPPRNARGRPASDSAAASDVEDMIKCRVCGAYVPARGALGCGQPGCPYGSPS